MLIFRSMVYAGCSGIWVLMSGFVEAIISLAEKA